MVVLKHFTIFTGKHLYWSLFLIKPNVTFLNYFGRITKWMLWVSCGNKFSVETVVRRCSSKYMFLKVHSSLFPTWVCKFVARSYPNFIVQNLLVGTLKVRRFKFVTQNERGWTGDEIWKSFDIHRLFFVFHLWPYDQGFENPKNTAYINNRFEISF